MTRTAAGKNSCREVSTAGRKQARRFKIRSRGFSRVCAHGPASLNSEPRTAYASVFWSTKRRITMLAFWPPKPKALHMPTST